MADIIDSGPAPFVANIETNTLENENYRTTMWTGKNLQVTLMAIQPGKDIGLEVHDTHDQLLRIEQGQAKVSMGPTAGQMQTWQVGDNDVVIVPAGTWHNLESNGDVALKVYSVYAPPQHPHGTVHITQEEAEAAEADEHNS